MKKKARLLVTLSAVATVLSLTACGTQWSGNYAGSWTGGVGTGAPITATTFEMTLYQSGSNVKGYWLATGGTTGFGSPSGQVTGSVNGNTLTATLTVPAGGTTSVPATGSYAGNLTLNNNTLTGSVSGTATTGTTGTFTASMSLTQTR